MAAESTKTSILSVIFKGIGTGISNNAAAQEADFNSKISSINRRLALDSGKTAIIKGEQEATISKLNTAATVADQVTGMAASNVVVNDGSAESIVYSTEALGALDAAIIRDNANRSARAFELEAQGETLKGQLAKGRGKAIQRGNNVELAGDLFSLGLDIYG